MIYPKNMKASIFSLCFLRWVYGPLLVTLGLTDYSRAHKDENSEVSPAFPVLCLSCGCKVSRLGVPKHWELKLSTQHSFPKPKTWVPEARIPKALNPKTLSPNPLNPKPVEQKVRNPKALNPKTPEGLRPQAEPAKLWILPWGGCNAAYVELVLGFPQHPASSEIGFSFRTHGRFLMVAL